jgi:hypothetical protein
MFAEVMPFCEQTFFEFSDIIDAGYCHYGKFAEVAVYYYRLGIGVGNYAYTGVTGEVGEFILEFGSEIIALYVMDRAGKNAAVYCNHAGAFRTHVAVVIYAVKKVVNTFVACADAKKTSHKKL